MTIEVIIPDTSYGNTTVKFESLQEYKEHYTEFAKTYKELLAVTDGLHLLGKSLIK